MRRVIGVHVLSGMFLKLDMVTEVLAKGEVESSLSIFRRPRPLLATLLSSFG